MHNAKEMKELTAEDVKVGDRLICIEHYKNSILKPDSEHKVAGFHYDIYGKPVGVKLEGFDDAWWYFKIFKKKEALPNEYVVKCNNKEESEKVERTLYPENVVTKYWKFIIYKKGYTEFYSRWQFIPTFANDFLIITFEEWNKLYNFKEQEMKEEFKVGDFVVFNSAQAERSGLKTTTWCKDFTLEISAVLKDTLEFSYENCKKGGMNPAMECSCSNDIRHFRKATPEEIKAYNEKNNLEIDHYEVVKAFPGVKIGEKFTKDEDGDYQNLSKDYVLGLADMQNNEFFKPVYKTKYELPKILGYKGVLSLGGKIQYGCAEFSVLFLKELEAIFDRNKALGFNRSIKSITLNSGVTLSKEQIIQINQFVSNQ